MKKHIFAIFVCVLMAIMLVAFVSCGEASTNKPTDNTEEVETTEKHEFGEWITEVHATCTENGVKGHYTCSICGKYFDMEFNEIVNLTIAAGHSYGEWSITKAVTCTENGERMRACAVCGISQRETLYSPGHQFGNWVTVKSATCERGFEERTCSVCGKVERNWLPADYTSHVWGEETCTVCGEHKASDGLQYEIVNGNEIAIWGYTGSDTTVYLPSSYIGCVVTTIRADAFKNQTQITGIVIPESITNIEYDAFSGCTNIQSATMPTNAISAIPKGNLKYVILNGGTSIGDMAFAYCRSLTSIEIPASVTSIGGSAFDDCRSLTIIEIPASVTSIGWGAFYGCSSLTSITIPFVGVQAGVTSSSTYQYPFGTIFGTSSYTGGTATTQYYYGSSTSSTTSSTYYIPSSLKTVTVTGGYIPYGAFYNCSGLTSIKIPSSVTSIGERAFRGCSSLTSITVAGGNTVYHSAGNCLIETASKTLIAGCKNSVIPTDGSVTSIGDYAFEGCRSLTSIEIPASVTSIGDSAFEWCSSLTSIEIPEGVTSIGEWAFQYCSSLTSVNITDIVKWCGISFGNYAANPLYYAHNLYLNGELVTELVIPAGVTSIGEGAFYGYSSLTSITVAEGNTVYHSAGNCLIETASKTLIAGCKNSVIPTDGSVTSIGERAFYYCSSLTSVEIPEGVTSIGDYAFDDCSSLTSIEIPASVTSIGNYAFAGCSSLTSTNYNGTKAQWNAISKGENWNYSTGNYTVYCTDGNISKSDS